MSISYDVFGDAFRDKASEYDFVNMRDFERNGIVDGYMKRSISAFKSVCKYDFSANSDDAIREYNVDVLPEDIDELADIISEGMLVQWMKKYAYHSDNLQNVLNTRDFTSYSPAELLLRISDAYAAVKKNFTNMIREYSYNHGDLTVLHL